MRCPDCNKFVGLETQDPEVNDLDIDDAGSISGNVRVYRQCADCSTELKETTFDIDASVEDLPNKCGDDDYHNLTIEETSCDLTESGGGRYKKNMIGFSLSYHVKCEDCSYSVTGIIEDATSASSFDELT